MKQNFFQKYFFSLFFMLVLQSIEREGRDRGDIKLPGNQNDLVSKVTDAAGGKPVIVIVISGGCVDVSAVDSNSKVNGQ